MSTLILGVNFQLLIIRDVPFKQVYLILLLVLEQNDHEFFNSLTMWFNNGSSVKLSIDALCSKIGL